MEPFDNTIILIQFISTSTHAYIDLEWVDTISG